LITESPSPSSGNPYRGLGSVRPPTWCPILHQRWLCCWRLSTMIGEPEIATNADRLLIPSRHTRRLPNDRQSERIVAEILSTYSNQRSVVAVHAPVDSISDALTSEQLAANDRQESRVGNGRIKQLPTTVERRLIGGNCETMKGYLTYLTLSRRVNERVGGVAARHHTDWYWRSLDIAEKETNRILYNLHDCHIMWSVVHACDAVLSRLYWRIEAVRRCFARCRPVF